MVFAALNDEESLLRTFSGAAAIFTVTDIFEPFAVSGADVAMESNVSKVSTWRRQHFAFRLWKHYVWSTLPISGESLQGKVRCASFCSEGQDRRFHPVTAGAASEDDFSIRYFLREQPAIPGLRPLKV